MNFQTKTTNFEIPPSSCDLLVENRHVMNVLSIYQLLIRFWNTLRLSPFRVETFCSALTSEENTVLLSDIFIALIKAIVKDDEQKGIVFGPSDVLHNYSILFYLMDGLTYSEVLRFYLNGLTVPDFDSAETTRPLSSPAAPLLDIDSNLDLLQILIDHFISTNARNQLMSSPELDHEDFCRSCGKIGELICCDRCTCVMHYECIPAGNIPENERVWVCTVCQKHNV
ncbi:nucleosome-remodeling factor subunit BPTF-like [Octopus sinensis]|uniref:Nucleosome-remodeling factor subunit BPTF-like n=1 Tax=Octopus sinensis TaxID=2607531 RepID=A0A6P7TP77_9MOLL|nr:nucleosome-remodeling factor subunit BPTF-like [Octopus sinensis]